LGFRVVLLLVIWAKSSVDLWHHSASTVSCHIS